MWWVYNRKWEAALSSIFRAAFSEQKIALRLLFLWHTQTLPWGYSCSQAWRLAKPPIPWSARTWRCENLQRGPVAKWAKKFSVLDDPAKNPDNYVSIFYKKRVVTKTDTCHSYKSKNVVQFSTWKTFKHLWLFSWAGSGFFNKNLRQVHPFWLVTLMLPHCCSR